MGNRLLKENFVFDTERYGKIIIMNSDDIPEEVRTYEKNSYEITKPTLNLKDHIGNSHPQKTYKIKSFLINDNKFIPLIKYTFINFPNIKDEIVKDDYMYLPITAKGYYGSEVASIASRLSRFLLWTHTQHRYMYIYLEVGNYDNIVGFNKCSAQTGSELLFNTDMLLQTSEYLKTYPNFCNSNKTYSLLRINHPLKSLTSFLVENFITGKEFNFLVDYDKKLNGGK